MTTPVATLTAEVAPLNVGPPALGLAQDYSRIDVSDTMNTFFTSRKRPIDCRHSGVTSNEGTTTSE